MKRLYWTSPDVLELEVTVATAGDCAVTTEPVLFHPDEGGQPADLGAIGPANVLNVEIVDGQVVHRLDQPLTDGKYFARVDRERRIHTAAHHTAQHILSGIAEQRYGLKTTGVHIGLERCTVDFDQKVEWETMVALETAALEIVMRDLPVETAFNEAGVRVRDDFKPIESEVVRVVKIADCDKSACCGAHVASTGRIGTIRVCDVETKKQGTRDSYLAGAKALEYGQLETNTLRRLRQLASCSTAELPSLYEKALSQTKEQAKEVTRLWSQALPSLVASAQVVEIDSSPVGVQVTEMPPQLVAKLAGMTAEAHGAAVVVSGTRIAINSQTLDAGALLKKIQESLGGKGGGSPKAANGSLGRTTTVDELVAILKNSD